MAGGAVWIKDGAARVCDGALLVSVDPCARVCGGSPPPPPPPPPYLPCCGAVDAGVGTYTCSSTASLSGVDATRLYLSGTVDTTWTDTAVSNNEFIVQSYDHSGSYSFQINDSFTVISASSTPPLRCQLINPARIDYNSGIINGSQASIGVAIAGIRWVPASGTNKMWVAMAIVAGPGTATINSQSTSELAFSGSAAIGSSPIPIPSPFSITETVCGSVGVLDFFTSGSVTRTSHPSGATVVYSSSASITCNLTVKFSPVYNCSSGGYIGAPSALLARGVSPELVAASQSTDPRIAAAAEAQIRAMGIPCCGQ